MPEDATQTQEETTVDNPQQPETPQNGEQTATTPAEGETPEEEEEQTFDSFDEWIEAQDDTVQNLINNHIGNLRSALDSERNQRRELSRQLRELSEQMEEGSEMQQQLDQVSNRLSEMERQAVFYEAIHAAGATNLRLAYLAASEAGLLDDEGNVDTEALKSQFPELFRQPKPKLPAGNAGSGAGQPPPQPFDMNAEIRRKAGRG